MPKGLLQRYDGPVERLAKVDNVAYRFALPNRIKVHHAFQIIFLKPSYDDLNPTRKQPKRALSLIQKENEHEFEQILNHKSMGKSQKNWCITYQVKWRRFSDSEGTWEKWVSWPSGASVEHCTTMPKLFLGQ